MLYKDFKVKVIEDEYLTEQVKEYLINDDEFVKRGIKLDEVLISNSIDGNEYSKCKNLKIIFYVNYVKGEVMEVKRVSYC